MMVGVLFVGQTPILRRGNNFHYDFHFHVHRFVSTNVSTFRDVCVCWVDLQLEIEITHRLNCYKPLVGE